MRETLIPKNAHERIRVGWNEYRGRQLLAGRVFYIDRASGEWRPGRHGLNLTPELWTQVALAVLREAGMTTAEDIARALAATPTKEKAGEDG